MATTPITCTKGSKTMDTQNLPIPFNKSFIPKWRGPVEGYAVNQIRKLLPRVNHSHDPDDLYQIAFEVYLFCKQRYKAVDNPAWFMALYKRCLFTRFADELAEAFRISLAYSAELSNLTEQTEECSGGLNISIAKAAETLAKAIDAYLDGKRDWRTIRVIKLAINGEL